jgi:hypothetical protein
MTPNPKRAYSVQPIPEPCIKCGDHATPLVPEEDVCLKCSAYMHDEIAWRRRIELKAFEASKVSDHA